MELLESLGKPQFINKDGVKWWFDKSTTDYAQSRKLKDATVWFVERPDGYMTRLLLINQNIIVEHQSLEGMGCHIDMLAIV